MKIRIIFNRIYVPLFILIVCNSIFSCQQSIKDKELPTSQMIVIVDKSKSVKYSSTEVLKSKVTRLVYNIYYKQIASEKFSFLLINANTGALTVDDVFESPNDSKDLVDSRNMSDQNEYNNILLHKNVWRNSIVNKIDELIKQENNAPATDVIGVFSAINNVVSNRDKSVDSFHVIILSDLVNTVDKSKGIRNGRDDFNQYLKNQRVSKLPVFANVFVKIIAPDRYVFKQSDLNYWTEFFTAFGVKEIKFER